MVLNENNLVLLEKKPSGYSGIDYFRCITALTTNPQKLVDIFWNTTEKDWKMIDATIESIKIVQTIDAETRIKLIVSAFVLLRLCSDQYLPLATLASRDFADRKEDSSKRWLLGHPDFRAS